ncbi:helix-turn-helix transcriptional regulator [Desulfovibrio sp. OttesenSCG-928-C06]|nr:helix-turn-helix transcriptional regulator [Desulfovibrio sp. OttesenSCG-928-C06]
MADRAGIELDVLCKDKSPNPVLFCKGDMPQNACFPMHAHEWGEFVYTFSGVIELSAGDRRYLVLPHYGIWIPPGVTHQCCNSKHSQHCSIYVESAFCQDFFATPCSIEISALMRSMLQHLQQTPACDTSDEHVRFLRVLLDQLRAAPRIESYLPVSSDPELALLLQELRANPDDNRSVKELARSLGITERTLARKCRNKLGITLLEWRQRLKTIKALEMLENGQQVESIALDLGYSSSSAFIAMFKRVMGKTPSEFSLHVAAGHSRSI